MKLFKNAFFIKIMYSASIIFILFVGSVVFANPREDSLQTIYHVYVDKDFIGTVNNEDVVQEYLNEQLEKKEKKYKDLNLVIGQDVELIPENVFHANYDNENVVAFLKDNTVVKVEATKLSVDGKLVGYLRNNEDAATVLQKIKEKFVNKDKLERFEDTKSISANNPIKLGESKLLDVSFSKKVSLSKEKIDPNDILTVEQAVKLLLKGTLKEKVHAIKKGEVLGQIADNYDLSMKQIAALNPGVSEDSILQIGQTINVTAYDPFVEVITKEEIFDKVEINYETEIQESSDLYKGQTKVIQQGKNGIKEVLYEVTKRNGQIIDKEILVEEVISQPVKKIVKKGTKVTPSRGNGNFLWPTVGGVVTSPMGQRALFNSYHRGIDISGVSNRSIKAIDNGTVSFVGWDGTYGKKIVINHNNGFKSVYGHFSSTSVQAGQTVSRGTVIGKMGSTGRTTGRNLHLELIKNGSLKNPLNYLNR